MKKTLIITTIIFMAISASAQADDFYFFDDFESGLTQWTIGGRQVAGQNIANTVSRHGSMMGHLYKTSFTEVTFERTFEYNPLLRFSFDMEVTASSTTPRAPNYYGLAVAIIIFADGVGDKLGDVMYGTATTSYIVDVAAANPTRSYNPVSAGVLQHYDLATDELLSQITIDETAISQITMQFRCYSSTYPNPVVSAELWVDNLTATDIPETSNQPPVADPDGPYAGASGSPISFDGTGSSDPDGDPLTYHWDFGDGSTGTGVDPIHTYAAAGIYDVSLTVTDSGGLSDTAMTHIDVFTNQPVVVDIKPGSYPNSINLKDQGVLPVAILGISIDVSTIDLSKPIILGGTVVTSRGPAKAPKLAVSFEDVDGDGLMDLVAFFRVQDLVTSGALDETTTELMLEAETTGGVPIQGTDTVNIVPPE